jgi:type I restriction enzyme S subunit
MNSEVKYQTFLQVLRKRYRNRTREQKELINALISIWQRCDRNGWGDINAFKHLCFEEGFEYWERLSEVLVASILEPFGSHLSFPKQGPDFLIEKNGKRIWIELITPRPEGLPREWTDYKFNIDQVVETPGDKILLRWTHAIKEKTEKLCGRICRASGEFIPGYLQTGIVSTDDIYVIAVNGRNLRGFGGHFPDLNSISQYPYAVKAVFGVGPIQINIDRRTLKATSQTQQIREFVPKIGNKSVPVDIFIPFRSSTKNAFNAVSAIWALDIDERIALGKELPMAIIHNPLATKALPEKTLSAHWEYVCSLQADSWQLSRHKGRYGSN